MLGKIIGKSLDFQSGALNFLTLLFTSVIVKINKIIKRKSLLDADICVLNHNVMIKLFFLLKINENEG